VAEGQDPEDPGDDHSPHPCDDAESDGDSDPDTVVTCRAVQDPELYDMYKGLPRLKYVPGYCVAVN
jgi:hypothetical protein